MRQGKELDLLKGPILPTLIKLAMPIMATSFVGLAYTMTDMYWVSSLGERAVAAVGTGGTLFWLVDSVFSIPRVGGQVLVGQALGAGERGEARAWARTALRLGYLLAALFSLLFFFARGPLTAIFQFNDLETISRTETYLWIVGLGLIPRVGGRLYSAILTASGNSFTPFVVFVSGLVLNMILDPLFILGLKLDVAGAALATLLSELTTYILLLMAVRRNELLSKLALVKGSLDLHRLKPMAKLGLPVSARSVVHASVSILISRIIVRFGDLAVAAQRLGVQVESLSWMTADGFASAVNAFMAQNFGAQKHDRVRRGYWTGLWLVAAFCLMTTLVLFFLGQPITELFFKDPEAIAHSVDYLRIIALSQLMMGLLILVSSAFASLGQSLIPSVIEMSLMAVRIPLAIFLAGTVLGVSGIWWSFTITTNVAGLILIVLFPIYMKRHKDNPLMGVSQPVDPSS
ncbi:MAG: MATE family efflux transporter [Clostridiaceae bacterium]|nr:MATE family efflux transporter [Clostridiaceae bacterium]